TGYSVVASTIQGNPHALAYVSLDCCSLDLIGKWVQLNHPSPEPVVVGFDILAPTKQYIQQGVISATVTQDAPLQGYDAIADLADYLLHGVPLHNINTGEHLVTKANVSATAAT
ncbi:MAG: substrate-binding domain-containing protein, partial [Ferrimicrobium acidiphilum]